MSFAQPIWLYLLPLLLLLFGGMVAYGLRRREALLAHFAASRLLDQLTEQASLSRVWIKAACVLLAVVAIGIALARPQLGVEWTERKARGLDIVFVIDSSKSMLASDIRPSRLDRAKLAVLDLLQRLESDRVGLVAFAGQAFLQTPPTLDYAAFRESLDAVDPNIMTSGGSDLGNAIKEAAEAFPSENNVKVVVLLTDGEDLGGSAAQAAEAARETGIQIFAIGIGTPEGAYLRIPNDQGIEVFVRDADGQPVRSQLDEATLQTIAQATGGSYRRLSSKSLDELFRSVIATLPREERESELQEVRIERFQWVLAAAIFLLVLETLIRRRRTSAVQAGLVLLAALCLQPNEANAQEAQKPEGTPTSELRDARHQYNQAFDALSAGDYASALQKYGAAIAQTENRRLQGNALYNMGHAAHQLGRQHYEAGELADALERMRQAEDFFESAQEINPEDSEVAEDLQQATRVRELVERIIEEQAQQDPPEPSSDESEQSEDSPESEDSENSEQNDQQEPGDEGQSEDSSQDESQSTDESGADSSEDNGEPSDENSSDPSENQDGPQSDQGDEASDDSDPTEASEPEESKDPTSGAPSEDMESTRDPVDDLPPPQPDEAEETTGDEGEPSAQPEPTSEGEPGSEDGAQSAMGGETVQGMSEADAAALLDSLRSREQLLPFNDASRTGRSRETRDW